MDYLFTFLEGVISFISPCMLPMLPIYITYFAGDADGKRKMLPRVCGFVLGFTAMFSLLGVFAGTLGSWLRQYQTVVNIVCGSLVILFGLSYLGVFQLSFLKGMKGRTAGSVLSAFLFGLVYSVSLTPCVGAFLGSALMTAAVSGGTLKGLLLLIVYSMGLGIPFVLSALLIDQLASAFRWIKQHYKVINLICGIFLIVVGLVMMVGGLNYILSIFS